MAIIANPKRPERALKDIHLEEIGVPAAYTQLWEDAGRRNNLEDAYDALLTPMNWMDRLDGTTVVDLTFVGPRVLTPEASDSIEKALLSFSGRPEKIDELFGPSQTGDKAAANPQVTGSNPSEGFLSRFVRFISGGEYTLE